MKKLFFLFCPFFISSVFGDTVSDFTNTCGNVGYDRVYAVFSPISITCLPDYFLPANFVSCVECPNGYSCPGGTYYFDETVAQGITTTNQNLYDFTNVNNMCASNIVIHRMHAVMTPHTYACPYGQFLPANSISCAVCPNGYTCHGGTYSFNETNAQGLIKNNNETYAIVNANNTCSDNLTYSVLNAVFTINIHTCEPGYYLPANVDGCTICPSGYACIGGTYTFNEEEDQGIEQCENSYAPAGSTICYPHVLHIGDDVVYLKSTKLTTPSLNVGMDDGIFYANMTTTPTPMNASTEHYLKIEYDGMIYYVCDDSTYGQ